VSYALLALIIFPTTGNAISVYFLYASDSGLVTITLDGQTFPTLDTYRSVDFLTCQLEVWSQDNLTPTAHTLTLTGHQTPANLSADADYLQLHKIVYVHMLHMSHL